MKKLHGIYQGMAEAVYRAHHAVSQSDLKLLRDNPPAKAHWLKMNPKEQTPAMALGQITHHAVIEPSLFEQEYVVRPKGMERRSNKGKLAWKKFEEENEGKIVLTKADWDQVCQIRDAVWAHPLASEILEGRKLTEASVFWEDPDTGLELKGRMDAIGEGPRGTTITDLKTTIDASPQAFGRQAANLGYAFQASFYLDALDILSPRERSFVLIAVEKTAPFLVAVYEFDWTAIDAGRRAYRSALLQWAECMKTGIWPGYPHLQTLELPRWALGSIEEETF